MVIKTDIQLGMRCPDCGKLDYHNLSRFSFSGGGRVDLKCDCGALKLGIGARKRKDYLLQVPCVVCETNHALSISSRMLWRGEVVYLYCPETGLDLGYLGDEEDVRMLSAAFEESMEALAREFEKEDEYFHNPEIMYQVLNRLHDIAEQGALNCQCGNLDVDVDIFPDRLELNCQDCGGVNIIYAETEEDLIVIRATETIELTRNGFKCLDSVANTGNKGKKNRRKRK